MEPIPIGGENKIWGHLGDPDKMADVINAALRPAAAQGALARFGNGAVAARSWRDRSSFGSRRRTS